MITNEAIFAYEAAQQLVTEDDLERRSEMFKALGDRNRLKLLYLLMDGERCVSDLLPFFDILQPTVSVHLLTLRDLGLLKVRKEGRRRYYSLVSNDILIQIDRISERVDRSVQ